MDDMASANTTQGQKVLSTNIKSRADRIMYSKVSCIRMIHWRCGKESWYNCSESKKKKTGLAHKDSPAPCSLDKTMSQE